MKRRPKPAKKRAAAKRATKKPAQKKPAQKKPATKKAATEKAATKKAQTKKRTSTTRARTQRAPATRATGKTAVSALSDYAAKRDFNRTPEPSGAERTGARASAAGNAPMYCIQKHAASRLHYDFRLELDGTLKSWAVPKGPSLDPADKRLAVHVEDHPLDYGEFEGVIPERAYGGGTVVLWDVGTWTPEGDARKGYRKGHLAFELHGAKLAGRWSLVRMGGRAAEEGRENWLLIKGDDEHAAPGRDLIVERPESVKTGRRLADVARDEGGTAAQQKSAARADPPSAAKHAAETPAAATRPAPKSAAAKRARPVAHALKRATTSSRAGAGALPSFVAPQLCRLAEAAPEGDDWLHEIKFDGFRMQGRVADGAATLLSRNRKPWSAKLPSLVAALARLPCRTALLDGEVILPTRGGGSSFEGFREAVGSGNEGATVYQVFDLLHLDGEDLRALPLRERKLRLAALLKRAHEPRLRYTDHVDGRGLQFFSAACRHRLEGSIAKRAAAPYRPGRGPDWLKIRCGMRQEFAVVGYTPSTTGPGAIGSLILAVHDASGHLAYAGRVGSGFSDAQRRDFKRQLAARRVDTPPLDAPAEPDLRDAVWSRPALVVDVSFTEWTSAGRLRHPVFEGLREDKAPADVVRERPLTTAATRRRAVDGAAKRVKSATKAAAQQAAQSAAKPAAKPAARPATRSGEVAIEGVRITHPERVVYTELGLIKVDLARYYAGVADLLLPHARLRPLSLVRCPEGRSGKCFFQKHTLIAGELRGIVDVPVTEKDGGAPRQYMSVTSAAGLVTLVQHGVIELHLWGSRSDDLERPDRVVFDLDPAPDITFADVMAAARDVREDLTDLGLESFVMTTGDKGLHVVLPLRRSLDFDGSMAFARAFSEALAAREPERFVTQASKARRKGRIFIDWLRNGRGATAVCPFSVRAREGAPVAMPLRWNELRAGLEPDGFRIPSVGKRLAALRRSDVWAGYAQAGRQSLAKTVLKALHL